MNTKRMYTTPDMEIVMLSAKGSCLTTLSETSRALGNSSTEEGTDYNNGNAIDW